MWGANGAVWKRRFSCYAPHEAQGCTPPPPRSVYRRLHDDPRGGNPSPPTAPPLKSESEDSGVEMGGTETSPQTAGGSGSGVCGAAARRPQRGRGTETPRGPRSRSCIRRQRWRSVGGGDPKACGSGDPKERGVGVPEQCGNGGPRNGATGDPKDRGIWVPKERGVGGPEDCDDGDPKNCAIGVPKKSGNGDPKECRNGDPKNCAIGDSKDQSMGFSQKSGDGDPEGFRNGVPKERGNGAPKTCAAGVPQELCIGDLKERGTEDPKGHGIGDPKNFGMRVPKQRGFGGPKECGNGDPKEHWVPEGRAIGVPQERGVGDLEERGTGDPRGHGNGDPKSCAIGDPPPPGAAPPGQGLRYLELLCRTLERLARLQEDNRRLRQWGGGSQGGGGPGSPRAPQRPPTDGDGDLGTGRAERFRTRSCSDSHMAARSPTRRGAQWGHSASSPSLLDPTEPPPAPHKDGRSHWGRVKVLLTRLTRRSLRGR